MTRYVIRFGQMVLALALACAALAGCYETPKPECAFLCGTNNACPDDYRCASDGVCKRVGVPDDFACGFTAQPPDAQPADAPPDAPPPVDGSADAMTFTSGAP